MFNKPNIMKHPTNRGVSFLVKYNQQEQSSPDSTSRKGFHFTFSSTHVKHVSHTEITGILSPLQTAHHLSTQIIIYVSSTHVKHVSHTEITESVRDKKLQNTQTRLPPTCSFCIGVASSRYLVRIGRPSERDAGQGGPRHHAIKR